MRSEIRIFNTEMEDEEGVGVDDNGGDGVLVPPPLREGSGRSTDNNDNDNNAPPPPSTYNVTVPPNVRPGSNF